MTVSPAQQASLYRNSRRLMAYPMCRTVPGFYLACGPFILIAKEEERPVADALKIALSASTHVVAGPGREEFAVLARPRLQAAGVRSERAFMKDAQLVDVWKAEGGISIIPYRNGGPSGRSRGFIPLHEKTIVLPSAIDDAGLGGACIAALALCE